ncbi:MAG: gliding motility-associated C-terminal domain-containing protein [Saprospiraceae bacterium]|nr:gliding motility-associated C-terminal domain-containing protein [Saprospiraceae bacterium]
MGILIILKGVSSVTDGGWKQINGTGSTTFSTPTDPKSQVKVDKCGTYLFEWSATNNECTRKDTVKIVFSFAPTISINSDNCNPTYTGYVVKLDVDACFSPVTVSGMNNGIINGKTFTSNLIGVDTSNYSFVVKDANGCQTVISGTKDCKCKGTIAGNIITDLQNVCVDSLGVGSVTASYTGYNLDANDSYHFILTDNLNNNQIGSIIAQNKTGIFQFQSGMQFGKTYYVVVAIGDSLGSGLVNLVNNPCLQYVGKPVVFTKIPTITITAPSIVECVKNVQIQGVADVGTGKWILKKISKAGLTASFAPSSASLTPKITVSDTGTYTFAWQVVNGVCTIEKEFVIKFNKNLNQTVLNVTPKCNAKDTTYQVVINLSGTAPFNTIGNSMKGTFAGNTFTSDPILSGLSYNFVIKDAKSCDSVVVKGKELCPCKAFAGTPVGNISLCSNIDTTLNLNDLIANEDLGGKWSVVPNVAGLSGNSFKTKGIPVGTYNFYYTLSGKSTAPPCEGDTTNVSLTINLSPVADAGADNFISCKQFVVNLGGKSTNDPAFNYLWTSPNGGIANSPTSLFTTTNLKGTYVLKISNKTSGCFAVDTVIVSEMKTKPKIDLQRYDPLCYNDNNGKIVVKISEGIPPYSFDFNGLKSVYSLKTDSLIFGFLAPGVYKLAAEDSLGCISKDSVTLTYPPLITTSLGPDVTVDFGDAYKLIAEKNIANEDIDTIIWKPVRLDSIGFWTDTFTIHPLESQKYCITLVTKNGCKAEDCVRISVVKRSPVFIPNVFRPDSDSDKNNRFFVNADTKYFDKILTLEIYNRWGDIMYKLDNFAPNDPSLGWDGSFNGKQMDPGVYVYYVKIKRTDGSTEIFKGGVTLVK